MSRGMAVGAWVATIAMAIAVPARAQDAPEPLSVVYEAPSGCPTSDAFFREVAARTTRARLARPDERARVMHVVVTTSGELHAGRLWIEDANTSSTARSVSGKTCGEVVGALALVGALAVDPRASTAPIATAPGVTEQAAAGATAAPQEARGASASEGAAARASERPAEAGAAAPDAASPAPTLRGRFAVGAQAEATFLADVVPSGRIFGDLGIGPRAGVVAPSFRVAVARSLDVDRTAAIGGATLRWTTVGLDACPLRFVLARPVALRPCAGGAVGVVDASGSGFAGTVSRSRPWATVSALGRLVWELLPFLELELEVGVIAPLYRESFFFAPDVSVYEAPPASLLSRAGFGLRFP